MPRRGREIIMKKTNGEELKSLRTLRTLAESKGDTYWMRLIDEQIRIVKKAMENPGNK
jgi:predicted secreted protein